VQQLVSQQMYERFSSVMISVTFTPSKNDWFYLRLQENNNLITNILASASVIMNEGMSD
jgi:hypothetical protein